MDNLLQLLLEAPITRKYAQDMIKRGQIVSVFYNRKWIKIEPVKIIEENGVEYLLAFQEGKPDNIYKYEFSKITNWNIVSTKLAKRAAEELKKIKKDPNKKIVTTVPPEPAASSEDKSTTGAIISAITNKRVVSMYYKGDKENPPGWRIGVYPVCYGKGTGFRSKRGTYYLRAWVSGGKSVSDNDREKRGASDPERDLAGWRFFRVDRILKWKPSATQTFNSDPGTAKGQSYNPNDKMISCDTRVDFVPDSPKETEELKESKMVSAIMEAVRIL